MALHRYIPLISIHSAIHKPPQIVHIMICVVKASSRLDIHSIRHTNRHSLQMIDIVSMIHTSQIMPPPPHGIQHNCVDLFATFRAVDLGDGVIEIHLLFAYALQQLPTMNASLVDAMCCHLFRPHLSTNLATVRLNPLTLQTKTKRYLFIRYIHNRRQMQICNADEGWKGETIVLSEFILC
eukprot:844695_1